MSSFNEQVQYNGQRVKSIMENPNLQSEIYAAFKSRGLNSKTFKENFMENTHLFNQIVASVAHKIKKGNILSHTYAGIVASIAKQYDVDYKVKSGVCFPPNYTNSPVALEDKEVIKKGKESGNEHPLFPNHTYIECGDKTYEYYRGYTEGIEKVDVVEVDLHEK